MKSLSECEILVTRPQGQAEAFVAMLSEAGAQVHHIPLLGIAPVTEESDQQTVKNSILQLDNYQKIIFVSHNAVAHGMAWIDSYWPQVPVGLAFFAVGATTAAYLESFGVVVANLAQDSDSPMTSEALLEAPVLAKVAGEKILIVRGKGGRGHLADVLAERGAKVDYCEVYCRFLPPAADTELQTYFGRTQSHRWVSLHSGETLQNFIKIIQAWPKSLAESAYNAHLLVPSQRVAAQAQAAGFSAVTTADNATDAAMFRALQQSF